MSTNKHPITGIAYGLIACRNLDDVLHTLLYEKGKDLSYEEAWQDRKAELGRAGVTTDDDYSEERELQYFADNYCCDEPGTCRVSTATTRR